MSNLSANLRREVEQDRTTFSPELHERVVRAVHAVGQVSQPASSVCAATAGGRLGNPPHERTERHVPAPWYRPLLWPAAGLAAAAVVAAVLLWHSPAAPTAPTPAPRQVAIDPPSLPPIGRLVTRLAPADDALARAIEQQTSAHLNDARRLGRFVLDQVSMAAPPQVP